MKRTALLATAVFAAATPALADPGHGMAGRLAHLLSQPDHLAILALLVGAGWFSFRAVFARKA